MTAVAWTILAFLPLGLVGAISPAGRLSRGVVYGGSAILCGMLLVSGLAALDRPPESMALPIGLAGAGSHLRLDPLAGFFLALIGLGGAGISVFAIGYARHDHDPVRVLPFYPSFLAAMALVVVADDAFSFLFGWESMSLLSWALVAAHHREADNARASFVYLLMAVFSGMVLLLAFSLMAGTDGHFAFDAMRSAPIVGVTRDIALLIALVGAGAKAGLIPVQVWLPLAHPAAPSQVSALMSGVMTKIAVYAFLRIALDLLGPTDAWTVAVVLLAGGLTAAYGVLRAMLERDLKGLLAYSTIENIGIIFIGIGLSLAFHINGLQAGAALALTAALFHALNHTVFKSLLFTGAGSVVQATGSRDLETMGGLIHRMPKTAFVVLVGCVAISGLPPLNGFVSEWLTFQAILLRPDLPQWALKLSIPIVGALLALTAALAAGCFVRLYGICFLGRPRTPATAQAQEVDAWSLTGLGLFATLCLLGGLFPGVVIDRLATLTAGLVGAHMPTQLSDHWLTIAPAEASRSSYNGLLIFAFIFISIILAIVVSHRRSHALRRTAAWDCGFPDPSPLTQYAADSFAQPMRRVFATTVLRAQDVVDMPLPGDGRPASIQRRRIDPIWDGFYHPLGVLVTWITGQANRLQFLTIRRYLGFVFASLILLLVALTIWQ